MTPEEAIERAAEIETETRYRHQMAREAFEAGRQSVLADHRAGFDLGYDTGYSARQDSRPFVHGVMAGFEEGCRTRGELAAQVRTPQPQAEQEMEATA